MDLSKANIEIFYGIVVFWGGKCASKQTEIVQTNIQNCPWAQHVLANFIHWIEWMISTSTDKTISFNCNYSFKYLSINFLYFSLSNLELLKCNLSTNFNWIIWKLPAWTSALNQFMLAQNWSIGKWSLGTQPILRTNGKHTFPSSWASGPLNNWPSANLHFLIAMLANAWIITAPYFPHFALKL